MSKVSVIIPGRCEPYFQETIDSALERATGDIEIIAVIDGYEPDPPLIVRSDCVKIVKLDESVGYRGAYNIGVKNSTGEYILKIDAHTLLSPRYDEILKSHCPHGTVVLPEMRRLNVFNWEFKPTNNVKFMYFGLDLYCHRFIRYERRPEAQVEYPEVMTGQGSCWFTTRKWNDYIGLLDEAVGSWGNCGIEVSLRTWLCGGTQILNRKVWQAHWFRKDEGGYPYPMSGRQVAKAHNYTFKKYYFQDNAFEHQVRPFKWLMKKFAPVPGWEVYLQDEYKPNRVIVYYTDSRIDENLARAVRNQLKKAAGLIPIVSVSQKPIKDFGRNICVGVKPYVYRSMYEQVLEGVKSTPEKSIIYLCEHDVFYHASHFKQLPKDDRAIWFNDNRYFWAIGRDTFLEARGLRAWSHGVAFREWIIRHCVNRLKEWEVEPDAKLHIRYFTYTSERPNIDIRHSRNLTALGHYKGRWIRGKTKGILNLPGWGGWKHFTSRVGWGQPLSITGEEHDA